MTSRLIDPLMDREKFDGVTAVGSAPGKTTFSIGELAREFNVTLRTLRFYEDKGLLNPERSGMTRIYSRRDRARLKMALEGKRAGFSLVEIREMIDLYDLRDGQVTQLRVAIEKYEAQIHKLTKQRLAIDGAITDLQRALDEAKVMLSERTSTPN